MDTIWRLSNEIQGSFHFVSLLGALHATLDAERKKKAYRTFQIGLQFLSHRLDYTYTPTFFSSQTLVSTDVFL